MTSYKGSIVVLIICIVCCLFIGIFDKNHQELETDTYTQITTTQPPTTSIVDSVENIEEPEIFIPVEIDLLSRVVFSEAGNQPYYGKVLVAATIKNRCKTCNYNTLYEVVTQKGQYATPRELSTITTPQELKQLEECRQAVIEVFNSDDTYGDIEYFCNPKICEKVSLKWFEYNLELVCVEGDHYFYKNKGENK